VERDSASGKEDLGLRIADLGLKRGIEKESGQKAAGSEQ
jgi:hypothetical protein